MANPYVHPIYRRGYHLFIRKPHILLSREERWLRIAASLKLSRQAKMRLEWIIWYHANERNALKTSRYFGIAPKTFWKWFKRFDDTNLRSLEDAPKRPKTVRSKEYTPVQYERVVLLRKERIRYGKMKLLALYRERYPEDKAISSWKIQCVIKAANLYYQPRKQDLINRKRQRAVKKKRITELKIKKITGFLICLDTIVLYWMGAKRYVFTAVDKYSKIAFARMYTTKSSSNAQDFLNRLHYLLDGKIENAGHDNGTEFQGKFAEACRRLNIEQYHSRIKTPKDNAVNERFNRTLREEFIQLGNLTADTTLFNRTLVEWLVEYNFRRPHQSLDYMPPINFHYKYHKVLPMYPSSTSP